MIEQGKNEREEKFLQDVEAVNRAFQIQLSNYEIKTDYRKSQTTINVTTNSVWEIEKATNTSDWCVAYESSNKSITVMVLEDYLQGGSRSHTFIIYSPGDNPVIRVKPVSLTVTQTGFGCTITPDNLNFEKEKGSDNFTVQLDNPTISLKVLK